MGRQPRQLYGGDTVQRTSIVRWRSGPREIVCRNGDPYATPTPPPPSSATGEWDIAAMAPKPTRHSNAVRLDDTFMSTERWSPKLPLRAKPGAPLDEKSVWTY